MLFISFKSMVESMASIPYQQCQPDHYQITMYKLSDLILNVLLQFAFINFILCHKVFVLDSVICVNKSGFYLGMALKWFLISMAIFQLLTLLFY